jgi:hypothetical protein
MLKMAPTLFLARKILNVPQRVRLRFAAPAAALDGHFEHPGEPKMQSEKLRNRSEIFNLESLILHCEAKP